MTDRDEIAASGIAVVGMAGRFPGAGDVDEFWTNIKAGVDSITRFRPAQSESAPDPDEPSASYVCARGVLNDIDFFDARFFGYLPREAEVMDPQHRLFLEIAWEALEHAGHDPARYPGAVGVFGGCYMDTYVLANLCADEEFRKRLVRSIQVGSLQTELGNDKDYLATRVAYKLGLTGPAMTVQTACSTSLVAVATACQSLDAFQCDMALAGGITIVLPQMKGYHYKKGGMLSPDGRCRPFDEKAAGTVFSHGAGVVVLKRLEDAIADRDTVYAVIRGYATNNDGGDKVSYTAPSVEGQSEVISLALGLGNIDPSTIGYVEAHGTATPLGDPIEIAGLAKAYRRFTDEKQYCAIGSTKANLGHLDVASGVVGLIKTCLALHERVLPPQINFEKPNPQIDFEASPFYVNTALAPWPDGRAPRRAAVSSFGVGGTNAHLVLEQAPTAPQSDGRAPAQLLLLAAKTPTALQRQADQLAQFLDTQPHARLEDVAYTLQAGRAHFAWRRAIAAGDRTEAAALLRKAPTPGEAREVSSTPQFVFMFPGQGAQYPGMGAGLYAAVRTYRETIDEAARALLDAPGFDIDIREFILCPEEAGTPGDGTGALMTETRYAQPMIVAVEIALARTLMAWGIRPSALIGHSVGEFAAAAVAGVFTLADAMRLVAERGRLMQSMAPGAMIAVMAAVDAVAPLLPEGAAIAAVNTDLSTVVSVEEKGAADLAQRLDDAGLKHARLATSHAFHSSMMEPARGGIERAVAAAPRADADCEIVSTATGATVAPGEFASPSYWGEQMVKPVQFMNAVEAAASKNPDRIFIEAGPGRALAGFVRRVLRGRAGPTAVTALGPPENPGCDYRALVSMVGELWRAGGAPDWEGFYNGSARRIALPTYPFERQRFWIDPPDFRHAARQAPPAANEPQSEPGAGQGAARPAGGLEDLIDGQLSIIEAQLDLLNRQR